MSRSDRDAGLSRRASAVITDEQAVSPEASASASPDAQAALAAHDHHGNQLVADALSGHGDAFGAVMADGFALSTGNMIPPTAGAANSAMLRAMRDAAERTDYDAGASVLKGLRPSGGEVLPDEVRARFEQAMDHNLAHVRIHRGSVAGSQSQALNAYAFTIGSHIWFANGAYDPNTTRGQQLLAHELTHVIQHDEGRIPHPTGEGLDVSRPTDPLEQEAYANEARIAAALPSVQEVRAPETEVTAGAELAPQADVAAAPAQQAPASEGDSGSAAQMAHRNVTTSVVPRPRPDNWEEIVAAQRETNPNELVPVGGEGHKLSDSVAQDFEAATKEVQAATGQNISKGLGDTTRPLSQGTNKPGADNFSWHKTGRAFDINQDLRWVIVEDPAGDSMFFRLYLAAKGDGGGATTVQFNRDEPPKLHYNALGNRVWNTQLVDVTAILERHGWSRIPAHKGWQRSYNKREWWHYEQRDENSWYDALDQIYDKDDIRTQVRKLPRNPGRLERSGFPQEEIDQIYNRNAAGPAPRQASVAPPAGSRGEALPSAVAEQLRSVLGDAVDQVRVHTGREAARFSEALNANAVTVGTDVFFNAGRFDLGSENGLAILAEEVHHAVVGGGGPGVSRPTDPHEREAKDFAQAFAQGMQGGGAGMLRDVVSGLGGSGLMGAATAGLGDLTSALPSPEALIEQGRDGIQATTSALAGAQTAVGDAISGATGALGGAMDGLSGALDGAMGSATGALDGAMSSMTQSIESVGLSSDAAMAGISLPEGVQQAMSGMQLPSFSDNPWAQKAEEMLPQVDASELSKSVEAGAEHALSPIRDGILPEQQLPAEVTQLASSLEGGLSGMGGMADRLRRGRARGAGGFSLNAAGPLPRDARNAERDQGASSEAEAGAGEQRQVQREAPSPSAPMRVNTPTTSSAGGSAAPVGTPGPAQAATPKEPVTATGTADHAKAVADASPSAKAPSYQGTASALDGHAKTEVGEVQDAIPEFHAVLTETGEAAAAAAPAAPAAAQAPAPAVETETPSTEPAPQVDVAPTPDQGEFVAPDAGAELDSLGEEAAPEAVNAAMSSALRAVPTTDGTVVVSPGPAPFAPETGASDPARAERDTQAALVDAQAGTDAARQAIVDSPGSERVQPHVMDEAFRVETLALPDIAGGEGVDPEVQKFLDSTVSGDVVASFDTMQAPQMEASHQAFEDSIASAVETRDSEATAQIEATSAEAQRLVDEANADQQATVAEQRGLIDAERASAMAAGQAAMDDYRAQASAERSRVSAEVRTRLDSANSEVAREYAAAEAEAERRVREAEQSAESERARVEREKEEQSWWEKAADWVADQLDALANAISDIFNAVRDAVTAVLDAVKELATQIIDAAVAFVCQALDQLGNFLKQGIQMLLGEVFPELAAALCTFVDNTVAWAQEKVTQLAEQLKEGISALIDTITSALDAIIDAFNAAVNAAMNILQAVISGDWVQILLALLEAALQLCGISPDAFYGVVGRAEETIDIIVNNPGQFIGNMINAVGQGFTQFGDNILTHLQSGLMSWLTGAAGEAGLDLPENFDLKGLVDIGLQILGLSYDDIREKAVEHFGEDAVEQVEFVIEFLDNIMQNGLVDGLWIYIEQYLDGVWDSVINGITEWVAETVVRKAAIKIATMFNPVGAIVQALLTAWDLYNWVKDNVQRIYAVVSSIVNSMHEIAVGTIGPAADMVEGALGGLVPVAIDLLAKVLGLGNAGEKVREFIEDVQEPIDQGLDQAFGWLKGRVDSVGDFLAGRSGQGEGPETAETQPGVTTGSSATEGQVVDPAAVGPDGVAPETGDHADNRAFLEARQPFSADGEGHHTWISTANGGYTVMVASTPTSGLDLIDRWQGQLNTNQFDNDRRSTVAASLRAAEGALRSLYNLEANLKGCKEDADRDRVRGLIRDRQTTFAQHVAVGFEAFGTDEVRNLEWALAQPENALAKHKWDQIIADVGRVGGLSGVLPGFVTAVEARLLRDGRFEEDGSFTAESLISAMRTVVAGNHSAYILKGDRISAEQILGVGGLGRVMNIPAVYGYNMEPSSKAAFDAMLRESPNEAAKNDPGMAFAWTAAQGLFDPDVDMAGQVRGWVPEGWWFAMADAQAVDLDSLREALTLNDTSFDAGVVKLSFGGNSFDSGGFELFKPTAFDGIFQGNEDDPMWASTGSSTPWGLTKSVSPVREGVCGPLDVRSAESRTYIKGSVSNDYDLDLDRGKLPDESTAVNQTPTGPDYLGWFAMKGSGAAISVQVNGLYQANRTAAGETAAHAAFATELRGTGWSFDANALANEWNRYKQHNEHIGWNTRAPARDVTENPAIKAEHEGSVEYKPLEGSAFVQGEGDDRAISDDDIQQGSLGDCYWMAAMSAVARDNPQQIENMVKDNGDGTFDVTLFNERNEAVTETFDTEFPMAGSKAKYARPNDQTEEDGSELWTLLMEKAWAKMGGGYGPIEGGRPGTAVQAITGSQPRMVRSAYRGDDQLLTELNEALERKDVVSAWTSSEERTSDAVKKLMDEYTVYANHAYSFRAVDVKSKTVTMRNPWASHHPKPMPVDVFKQIYPYIDFNKMGGSR